MLDGYQGSRDENAMHHLARLPLERRVLQAAGRSWLIDAVGDQDQLLNAADGLSAFPFGLMLWESAAVLADHLAKWPGGLAGLRALEIGSGVGLAGLAARALGADLVQTDHSAEALTLCRHNAALNNIEGIDWRLADWTGWRNQAHYDLVIGSDVLYDANLFTAVRAVLETTVSPGGTAVLTDPGRSTLPEFIASLQHDGWITRVSHVTVPALKPVRDGETISVSVIEASRLSARSRQE
jgi:predicted nicotinamide N-methyase